MASPPGKVVLDTDAAILIGNSNLAQKFFKNVPVAMTDGCIREIQNNLTGRPQYVQGSAADVDFHLRRGHIDDISVNSSLSPSAGRLNRNLHQKYQIDSGERTILAKLLADDPSYWIVSAQDSDARAALLEAKKTANLSVMYIGTPAMAFRALTQTTSVTKRTCLSTLETEVKKEGWSWQKYKAQYEAELDI